MEYNAQKARAAVQYLVDTPWFPHRVRGLRRNVLKPRALPYSGEEDCLNELLVIGRQNPQALENLIALAEFKRGDRNDYQREFMAKQRAREKKAIRLEELLVGKTLKLDARNAVVRRYKEQWAAGREEFLKSYGELTWEEKNEVVKSFWAQTDAGLDELVAEAEATLTKEVKRKRVVQVEKKLANPTLRDKLKEQLDLHTKRK